MRIRSYAALVLGPLSVATVLVLPTATPATPQPTTDLIGQVTQLSERDTVTSAADASGQRHMSVCHAGAKWMRLRFTQLTLHGEDFIKLNGSAGGVVSELTSKNWTGRAFHTRAFKGECVDITPRMSDSRSSYTVSAYQAGMQDLEAATVTVAAVGDICGSSCDRTADLVEAMAPNAAILAGDLAYDNGSLNDYNTKYDPQWGQFRNISYPTPGNHEYNTSSASGYFDYWNGVGNNNGRAGERGKGYYSFDVGDWHFVALNSNISRTATSAQVTWLRNDLAANTKPCTAAFWHHPLFNKGSHGDDSSVRPFYQALYDYKADLAIVGHDHNYQRFNLARPDGTVDTVNGVRQILYGTGGRGFYSLNGSTSGPLQASNASTFGVGKLTLTATGYTAAFVPVAGSSYTDSTNGTCHKAQTQPDYSVSVNPGSTSIAQGASGTASVTATSTGGFTGTVNWQSVSGLPSGATATFNPTSVALSANGTASSTMTVAVGASTPVGTYNLTITGTSGTQTRTTTMQLTVTGTSPTCGGTNGTDVQIPDNTTVESSIVVSGCSGNASSSSKAEVHIVHTYRGDLVVTLVAPDGSTYTLLNRSGGSADNVDQTFTVNLSGEARNGTWKLRVRDAASQDIGYINSWTLTL